MKCISVSDDVHKWIMDHKDSNHKSADDVLVGVIDECDILKKDKENLKRSTVVK